MNGFYKARNELIQRMRTKYARGGSGDMMDDTAMQHHMFDIVVRRASYYKKIYFMRDEVPYYQRHRHFIFAR